jgi:hypothetical protein
MPCSARQIPGGSNGFDDAVSQFCAAAHGFEAQQIGQDSSHAGWIIYEKDFVSGGFHNLHSAVSKVSLPEVVPIWSHA